MCANYLHRSLRGVNDFVISPVDFQYNVPSQTNTLGKRMNPAPSNGLNRITATPLQG